MDYEQQLAGRSSHDPSRVSYRARPEGGTGGVFLVVAVIVAALAVAFRLAGSPPGGDVDGGAPAADPALTAPLAAPMTGAADPVTARPGSPTPAGQ